MVEILWGARREVLENSLQAFVSLLRRKIGECGENRLLETHHGLGYSVGAQTVGLNLPIRLRSVSEILKAKPFQFNDIAAFLKEIQALLKLLSTWSNRAVAA